MSPQRPINHPVDAVRPKSNASSETPERQPSPPIQPQIHPSPEAKRETKQCRPDQTPWWKYAMEFAAILVGIAVAWIYGKQLGVMQDQLTEAQKATRLSQRPWVSIDDELLGFQGSDLRFDKDSTASAEWTIRARNYSNSAAQNVLARATLMVTADYESVRAAERDICEDISKPIPGGIVLFGGRTKAEWKSGHAVHTNEMDHIPPGSAFPFLSPKTHNLLSDKLSIYMPGCIAYRDQFEYPYCTGFIYRLEKANPDPNSPVKTPVKLDFPPTPNTQIGGVWLQDESAGYIR